MVTVWGMAVTVWGMAVVWPRKIHSYTILCIWDLLETVVVFLRRLKVSANEIKHQKKKKKKKKIDFNSVKLSS